MLSTASVSVYAQESTTVAQSSSSKAQSTTGVAMTDAHGKAVTNQNGETVTMSPEEALNQQKVDLEAKLKESEEKLAKYQKGQMATEEYINSLDEKIGYMNQDLSVLDTQINSAREKIRGLKQETKQLKKAIKKVQKQYYETAEEIDELNKSFQKTYSAYCLRMRAMYISGSDSILVALLTSKDISQFLSRYEMIKAVSKSDAKLLKEAKIKTKQISEKSDKIAEQKAMLENSKAVLEEKSAIIENERDGIESKQAEIAQKKIILAQDRAESDALLAEYAQKTHMYSEYKYEDEELLKQVDNEISSVLSGLKTPEEATTAVKSDKNDKKNNTTSENNSSPLYYNSAGVLNLTYPAPGHYSVSCAYGRYSSGKAHTGTDYPYPVGSKVVAAQKGIVIKTRELNYSYGKYVMIYHGTDNLGRKIVTLYAHNSQLLVSTGQTVKKGQQIARGGSTGNSTGPHCHFELIIDGSKVNSAPYLSK